MARVLISRHNFFEKWRNSSATGDLNALEDDIIRELHLELTEDDEEVFKDAPASQESS